MAERTYYRRRIVQAMAAASVSGLAGCSGDGQGDGDDGETESDGQSGNGDTRMLQFAAWGPEVEREAHNSALDSFEQEREDITTEYVNIPPEEFHDRLRTQFSAGEEPDTFYMEPSFIPAFSDRLVVQEEEHPDDFVNDFYDNVIEGYRFNDTLYNMPFTWAVTAPVYDKELLSTAGYEEMPTSWSGFREALVAINEQTDVDYPLYQPDDASSVVNIWHPLLVSNGGQVMTDDGSECVVGSDEAVEALEYVQDLRENDLIGLLSEVGAQSDMGALNEGQVAIITGGAWLPTFIEQDYPELFERLGTSRPPKPSGGEFGNMVFAASVGISSNSEVKGAALEFVRHMLDDAFIPYYGSGIGLPVRESHREQIDLYNEDDGDSRWKNIFQIKNDTLRGFIWGEHTPEIKDTLYSQIEGVMQGQIEARDALETTQEQVNDEILDS